MPFLFSGEKSISNKNYTLNIIEYCSICRSDKFWLTQYNIQHKLVQKSLQKQLFHSWPKKNYTNKILPAMFSRLQDATPSVYWLIHCMLPAYFCNKIELHCSQYFLHYFRVFLVIKKPQHLKRNQQDLKLLLVLVNS